MKALAIRFALAGATLFKPFFKKIIFDLEGNCKYSTEFLYTLHSASPQSTQPRYIYNNWEVNMGVMLFTRYRLYSDFIFFFFPLAPLFCTRTQFRTSHCIYLSYLLSLPQPMTISPSLLAFHALATIQKECQEL